VVDDDLGSGKVGRELGPGVEVPPGGLQIVRQSEALEQAVPRSPARIVHRPGLAAPGIARIARGLGLVADAAHERVFGVPGEHLFDVMAIELRVSDAGARQAECSMDLLDPVRLAHRIGAIPFGLDVDGLDNAVPRHVAAIIGRQVVAPDRRIIAVTERNGHRIAKPGVIIPAEIPEVLMRIDDGKFVSPGYRIRQAHRMVNADASRRRARKAHRPERDQRFERPDGGGRIGNSAPDDVVGGAVRRRGDRHRQAAEDRHAAFEA